MRLGSLRSKIMVEKDQRRSIDGWNLRCQQNRGNRDYEKYVDKRNEVAWRITLIGHTHF
jgi:hypothetical protein